MNHPHDNEDPTIPSPEPTDDLREAGINVGKPGFYDPERGAKKEKTQRPEPIYGPKLATDPGQPDNIEAGGITREKSGRALDKSEPVGVDSRDKASKPTARKAPGAKEATSGN